MIECKIKNEAPRALARGFWSGILKAVLVLSAPFKGAVLAPPKYKSLPEEQASWIGKRPVETLQLSDCAKATETRSHAEFFAVGYGLRQAGRTKISSFVICVLALLGYLRFDVCHSSLYAQDKVIAVVNNDVITQKDLEDFTNFMRMQLSTQYNEEQLEGRIESMKPDLLDKLIEDRLILQEAGSQKIQIDEGRVKSRIDEIKNKLGSDAGLEKSLSQQGLVRADLERKIREQLLMYNVIEVNVRRKIEVSPSEITDFYNRNKNEFVSYEEREFESIAADEEPVVLEVYDRWKQGLSLEEVCEKFKLQVNKLNITKGGHLKQEIETVVFNLNSGEVSKPVKIENKFYVFKLNKISPSRQQTLDEAKDTIQNYLFEKKMQEELEEWLGEIKKRSYIKIVSD